MTFKYPPFFKAIGHPVRQSIMEHLYKVGDVTVHELVGKLNLAQSTVSHHLAILKKAQVVKAKEKGTETLYSVCCPTISKCCHLMQRHFKK